MNNWRDVLENAKNLTNNIAKDIYERVALALANSGYAVKIIQRNNLLRNDYYIQILNENIFDKC